MKPPGTGLILLLLLALAAPAAAQVCQAIPKHVTGRTFASADGVASAASPEFTVRATNTRTGAVAISTTPLGSSYWFDAGSIWGTWCVGDTVQVAVTVSTGSGIYSAVATKALTTENPEVFPDATFVPGPPPLPSSTPSPTPAPSAPAAPGAAPPAAPLLPLVPTPKSTAAPSGATPRPAEATPTPATVPPGGVPAATAAPAGEGLFVPPLPPAPARSPGLEVWSGVAALAVAALAVRRR